MAATWSLAEVGRLLTSVDHCIANGSDLAATLPDMMKSRGYNRTWGAMRTRLTKLSGRYRTCKTVGQLEWIRQHGSRGLNLPHALSEALRNSQLKEQAPQPTSEVPSTTSDPAPLKTNTATSAQAVQEAAPAPATQAAVTREREERPNSACSLSSHGDCGA